MHNFIAWQPCLIRGDAVVQEVVGRRQRVASQEHGDAGEIV